MSSLLISIIEEDARAVNAAVKLDQLAGKSILLTGASGLLGTHFLASIREFVQTSGKSLTVNAVVNSEATQTLRALLDFSGALVLNGDLTDPEFLNKLDRYDYIIHAAGYGQPNRFMTDPVKTIKLNTVTTLSLFEKLKTDGRFLFISTSEVYSGLPNPPYNENQIGTTNTTHPRACYIEGKRGGEAICNAYRNAGVKAFSARLALAYGPGTKPQDRRVLNSFIERGISQKQIVLQDLGVAKRTYCYVSDAIEILFNIIFFGAEPVYNVGGVSRTTIAALAVEIGEILNVPVEFPKIAQEMGGAPEDVQLDMSLVEAHFKKSKYVSLNVGLAKTIAWQRALYDQS